MGLAVWLSASGATAKVGRAPRVLRTISRLLASVKNSSPAVNGRPEGVSGCGQKPDRSIVTAALWSPLSWGHFSIRLGGTCGYSAAGGLPQGVAGPVHAQSQQLGGLANHCDKLVPNDLLSMLSHFH